MFYRYGNVWSQWHGKQNGDITSIELNSGSVIKSVEGASIDNSSFYMLKFSMSDGIQNVMGMSICSYQIDYSGGRMRFYGRKIQTFPSVYQQLLKV